MTVNKERVQLLVDALRSGEFVQGTGSLISHTPEGPHHCCLGVATEVALRNGVVMNVFDEPWEGFQQVMCVSVYEWFGFEHGNPTLGSASTVHPRAATVWNDDYGASFQEIADAFERTYITNETDPA